MINSSGCQSERWLKVSARNFAPAILQMSWVALTKSRIPVPIWQSRILLPSLNPKTEITLHLCWRLKKICPLQHNTTWLTIFWWRKTSLSIRTIGNLFVMILPNNQNKSQELDCIIQSKMKKSREYSRGNIKFQIISTFL